MNLCSSVLDLLANTRNTAVKLRVTQNAGILLKCTLQKKVEKTYQDKVQCQAFISMAVNHRVPQKR